GLERSNSARAALPSGAVLTSKPSRSSRPSSADRLDSWSSAIKMVSGITGRRDSPPDGPHSAPVSEPSHEYVRTTSPDYHFCLLFWVFDPAYSGILGLWLLEKRTKTATLPPDGRAPPSPCVHPQGLPPV